MADPTPHEFIAALRVRHAAARGAHRAPSPGNAARTCVRQVEPTADRVATFARAAAAAGCRVERSDRHGLAARIAERLAAHGARRVWIEPDTAPNATGEPAAPASLAQTLRERGLDVTHATDRDTLFALDAAITAVACGVAETGSLVCTSGPGQPRGASLLPPLHLALLPAGRIVPDLCDWFDALGPAESLPANIVLITSPSKTADIEGVLVTGVHGPSHVEIFVYD